MERSLSLPSRQLARRNGEYGFDEPEWPLLFGLLGGIFLVLGFLSFWVLLMAASLLPGGKATGIDVWKTREQSGNALSVTQQNAVREGVAGSIVLHTADMQHLPFSDGSFDLVVSSLAIHNIRNPAGRKQALGEAARVLKPGGRPVVADFFTRRYGECLREFGMTDATLHALDWRFWYGGPWAAPKLVSARKPS